MIHVAYDHQIFSLQRYGGISRYFCELSARIGAIPGFDARIVAPLHFNAHLRSSPSAKFAMHADMPFRGADRWMRAVNRAIEPRVIGSPSIIHRTFYRDMPRPKSSALVVTVFDMINELFPAEFPPEDTVARNKRIAVSAADHIVCISESTARDLMQLLNVPRTKISVTYLGFSEIFSSSSAPARSAPAGHPYVLYVGHRAGYKNFQGALRAYARATSVRDAFDFVTFGGAPFDTAELALIAKLAPRPDAVRRITGSDAELAEAYRQAHAFVYPSRYEGFGIPPLEAMSAGCVVGCSNTSSIPEVVGDAAVMFDPHSEEDMATALERLCFDEDLRTRLVEAGYLQVSRFSWERCAQQTADAYRRALAGPGAPAASAP